MGFAVWLWTIALANCSRRPVCWRQPWSGKLKGTHLAEWTMPKITVVGFCDKTGMREGYKWWEERYGRQLDRVMDTDGQQIGLGGFLDHVGRQ